MSLLFICMLSINNNIYSLNLFAVQVPRWAFISINQVIVVASMFPNDILCLFVEVHQSLLLQNVPHAWVTSVLATSEDGKCL